MLLFPRILYKFSCGIGGAPNADNLEEKLEGKLAAMNHNLRSLGIIHTHFLIFPDAFFTATFTYFWRGQNYVALAVSTFKKWNIF